MNGYIFCGDRWWEDKAVIRQVMYDYTSHGDVIIHGAASGADEMSGLAARALGRPLILVPYFGHLGRSGGPARNKLMLQILEHMPFQVVGVHAFHSNISSSKGTKNMVTIARKAEIPVTVWTGKELG